MSFAYFHPDTSSWRTSQDSDAEEWDESSVAWPRSGTWGNGIASLRASCTRTTNGIVRSSLHTALSTSAPPAAMSFPFSASGMWPTPLRSRTLRPIQAGVDYRPRRGRSVNLDEALALCPSPWSSLIWSGILRSSSMSTPSLPIDRFVRPGGVTNPQWIEWLMGYPKDWTLLPTMIPTQTSLSDALARWETR